jgi:hypothetical protein
LVVGASRNWSLALYELCRAHVIYYRLKLTAVVAHLFNIIFLNIKKGKKQKITKNNVAQGYYWDKILFAMKK